MLTDINWTSLVTRKHHARLTMMYKMINVLAAVQYQQYIIPVERESCHIGSHSFQTLHSHRLASQLILSKNCTRRELSVPGHCPGPVPVLIQMTAGLPVDQPSLLLSLHTHTIVLIFTLLHFAHPTLSTIFS